jgi:hypothetical protein
MADEPIGYRNPPKQTRFQPGESGNPGGRPKRPANLRADFEAELAAVRNKDGAVDTNQRAFTRAVVRAAIDGEPWAANIVMSLSRLPPAENDGALNPADQAVLDDIVEREIQRRAKSADDANE